MLAPPEAATVESPSDNTSATRHLSAGAYIDSEFCLKALREIYHQPKRIVAPSYGFDLITVLGHCLRARQAMVVRDALIVGVLLLASLVSVTAVILILLALFVLHATVIAGEVLQESMRYLRDEQRLGEELDSQEDVRLRGTRRAAWTGNPRPHGGGLRRLWLANIFLLFSARVATVALAYLKFAAVIGGFLVALLAAGLIWDVDLVGVVWFGLHVPATVAGLTALWLLIPAGFRAWNQLQLRALSPDQTPEPPVALHRLTEIDRQSRGNTVVYSGYRPFVGSGELIRHWNLAQRLVHAQATLPTSLTSSAASSESTDASTPEDVPEAKREFDDPPFAAQEIIEHVRKDLSVLADDPVPEHRLPGLQVDDKIFVAGTEIDKLQPHTPEDQIKQIITNPTAPQRHYLVCQVVSWHGELVTTVYVHIAVQGKALYVELQVTALLPCDERFRVVDQIGATSLNKILRNAGRAVLEAPILVATAPANLARAGSDMLDMALASPAARTRVKRGYDYGAVVGLRELAASPLPHDPMQRQDITKYSRVIERRVLAAILDFLEDRNVDVNEYRQRSLTILNAGAVAVDGGTVNVTGDAVGTQNTQTTGGND